MTLSLPALRPWLPVSCLSWPEVKHFSQRSPGEFHFYPDWDLCPSIQAIIMPIKVLFICSRNQWRSPTAEKLWQNHPGVLARSAGTSPNARRTVSVKDLEWAEVIFVMEDKHKSRLMTDYRHIIEYKPLHVLDIPDEYQFMDAELVEILRESVTAILRLDTLDAKLN